jgi:hypothetical protein
MEQEQSQHQAVRVRCAYQKPQLEFETWHVITGAGVSLPIGTNIFESEEGEE